MPELGPFMNAAPSGKCRRPISTPGVSVGISARLMPRSSLSPSKCSGSWALNAAAFAFGLLADALAQGRGVDGAGADGVGVAESALVAPLQIFPP